MESFIKLFKKCITSLIDLDKVKSNPIMISSRFKDMIGVTDTQLYQALEFHYVPVERGNGMWDSKVPSSHASKGALEKAIHEGDEKAIRYVLDLHAHWFLEDMARNLVVNLEKYKPSKQGEKINILILDDKLEDNLLSRYQSIINLLNFLICPHEDVVAAYYIKDKNQIYEFKQNCVKNDQNNLYAKPLFGGDMNCLKLEDFRYIYVDLLIGDNLSGLDIIKQLMELQRSRKNLNEKGYDYEIIMVSRSTNTEDIQRALNYGASQFILKERIFSIPYRLAELGPEKPQFIDFANTFRSLQMLPVHYIKKMQTKELSYYSQDNEDDKWIKSLPKADLHFHLGGGMDAYLTLKLSFITLIQYLERFKRFGSFNNGFFDESSERPTDVERLFRLDGDENFAQLLADINKHVQGFRQLANDISQKSKRESGETPKIDPILKKIESADNFYMNLCEKYRAKILGFSPLIASCLFNICLEFEIEDFSHLSSKVIELFGNVDNLNGVNNNTKLQGNGCLEKLIQATHGNSLEQSVGGISLASFLKGCDYTGSDVMQTRCAIEIAIKDLCQKAVDQNIVLLNIRITPMNLSRGGLSAEEIWGAIRKAYHDFLGENDDTLSTTETSYPLLLTFTIALKRHYKENDKSLKENIDFGVKYKVKTEVNIDFRDVDSIKSVFPCVTGFDLTGLEKGFNPDKFREYFRAIYAECMPITIHAGEETSAQYVWEAAYELNADRVGHGLSLVKDPKLMNRFKDFDKCVELCPSSNFLTQEGFLHRYPNNKDNGYSYFTSNEVTSEARIYPSASFLDNDLSFVVCTDDPAIQNTDLSKEYLWLSEMTIKKDEGEGGYKWRGITRWEALKLIRNGFKYSFLPQTIKKKLLAYVDNKVFKILEKL